MLFSQESLSMQGMHFCKGHFDVGSAAIAFEQQVFDSFHWKTHFSTQAFCSTKPEHDGATFSHSKNLQSKQKLIEATVTIQIFHIATQLALINRCAASQIGQF